MEFPATGGVIPSFTFRTTKLIRYVTTFDYFIMACEIAYIVFIIYFAVEELIEVLSLQNDYFRSYDISFCKY
jgi:polycystin 2